MIEPFVPGQRKHAHGHKLVSYGSSSYGYETSYRDRGGKYQGQVGVTLPKI